jgi:hypothetical protein
MIYKNADSVNQDENIVSLMCATNIFMGYKPGGMGCRRCWHYWKKSHRPGAPCGGVYWLLAQKQIKYWWV